MVASIWHCFLCLCSVWSDLLAVLVFIGRKSGAKKHRQSKQIEIVFPWQLRIAGQYVLIKLRRKHRVLEVYLSYAMSALQTQGVYYLQAHLEILQSYGLITHKYYP